jgi:hypothetical protein
VEREDEGFLPPEPPGAEPDLGGGQAPQQPPPQPPPGYQQQPPPYQPPPSGQPPPPYQPPPAYQGWQPPPPVYPPPPSGYYGWAPAPPRQPDNGPALAGFIVSMVSGGLWLISAGWLAPLSIPGAIVGMVLARRGKQKVESGETQKHKDLANAGWWIGIGVIVLSVLSTIAWVLFIVLASTSDSFDDNMRHEFDDSQVSSSLRVGLAATRLAVGFVS